VTLTIASTVPGREAHEAIRHAIECGYRHIDTAALYGNEADDMAALDALDEGLRTSWDPTGVP
jgi:diketogulonate reductase-like aldo/keto reductase